MYALVYLYEVLFRLRRDTLGAVAAEYAFLLVFISIVAAIGMAILGGGLLDYFSALGLTIGNSASQS